MFCQLEVLRHCFPASVRHILEELPDSLDETYERILREIRKPNQEHALRLMHCLVAAVRPLRLEELAEVLAVDFKEGIPKLNPGWRWDDKEEAVMSACSSLVMIVKNGYSRVVQFSHFSVKEFLTANRLVEPIKDVSRYHIRLEAAHTILAQACLGVLLRLDDQVDRDKIKNFPLAGYAAQHGVAHAGVENSSSHIKDGMECLFDEEKPHFATWLWIYNADLSANSRMLARLAVPRKPIAVPLYYAARLGFRDLAEHLIAEYPEHVKARGGAEVTPMHVAARAGHADILSLLLDHGAGVDDGGHISQTPLHRASYFGKVEAGQILLDRGADIHARDVSGRTPLYMAVDGVSKVRFVQMLLKHGARINDRNHDNYTPLHRAVEDGSIQTVRLLLEHGADVNARNHAGRTPSDMTSNQEILELMSEYSAKSVT